MKTILVLTDFSINADYAAQYALGLAQKIEANLLVCNIYEVPAGEETTDRNSWPLRACEDNSIYDLGELVARLKTTLDKQDLKSFRPDIEQRSEEGMVGLKLKDIMSRYDVLLAVISAHNSDTFNGFFVRNHTWDIIDNATFPVLVIPYQIRFKPFKRMAFATVMNDTDIKVLESFSGLAKYSDAEVLITNVTSEKEADHNIRQFFSEIQSSKIFYRDIIGFNVVSCLKRLCEDTEIDLLAIVHSRHSVLQEIIGGSVTRKMADNPDKPLLIYPCSTVEETVTVL
ncbi:MAG: universal stress protein UspE [Mucilaginibacter sp.]|nr:universal stress protein UspE [Mucilaginibacter sp.]